MAEPFFTEEQLMVGGKTYTIRSVGDIEKLFDELVQLPDNHPSISDERIPYWAEVWPSAIALAEWISSNSPLIEGKSVLEIGCGLGLPGIVASETASKVCLTDYMEEPLKWAALNWSLNRADQPDVRVLDWRAPDPVFASQVVLASDVAYEKRMFLPLSEALQKLVVPGGIAVLAEPGRRLAKEFLNGLQGNGFRHAYTEAHLHRKGIDHRVGIHLLEKSG